MRSALVAGIAIILAVAGLAAGYSLGNATSHTETTTSTTTVTSTYTPTWTVLVQNGTFTGQGCHSRPAQVFMALRVPCLDYSNSTTWYASMNASTASFQLAGSRAEYHHSARNESTFHWSSALAAGSRH